MDEKDIKEYDKWFVLFFSILVFYICVLGYNMYVYEKTENQDFNLSFKGESIEQKSFTKIDENIYIQDISDICFYSIYTDIYFPIYKADGTIMNKKDFEKAKPYFTKNVKKIGLFLKYKENIVYDSFTNVCYFKTKLKEINGNEVYSITPIYSKEGIIKTIKNY